MENEIEPKLDTLADEVFDDIGGIAVEDIAELWLPNKTVNKTLAVVPDGGFEQILTDQEVLTRKQLAMIITKLRPKGVLAFGRRIDNRFYTINELAAALVAPHKRKKGEKRPTNRFLETHKDNNTTTVTKKQRRRRILKIDKETKNIIDSYDCIDAAAAAHHIAAHQMRKLIRGIRVDKHTRLSREMWELVAFDWKTEKT